MRCLGEVRRDIAGDSRGHLFSRKTPGDPLLRHPSVLQPLATTRARTGKSLVSSVDSQKSLHDEVAQLRARLDAVERRTAADLLAMETDLLAQGQPRPDDGVAGVAGARRDALELYPPRLKTMCPIEG